MILGSVLLIGAAVVLLGLLVRLSSGRPGAVERFALTGVAIALILGGSGIFAAGFLSPSDGAKKEEPNNAATPPDSTQPVADLPQQAEALSKEERASLDWLHRSSVEIFIERPGFGMRRMVLPLNDVVTPPKLTSNQVVQGQEPESLPLAHLSNLNSPIKGAPNNRDSHYAILDVINQHWRGPSPVAGEQWSVQSVQLVGLVKNPEAVAYDSNKMPGMKEVKDLPKRKLNAFEARALESLRGGERIIAEKTGKEMRVMGPIFAGNRCVSCHEQKGQMLGAFTYVLERRPVKKDGTFGE